MRHIYKSKNNYFGYQYDIGLLLRRYLYKNGIIVQGEKLKHSRPMKFIKSKGVVFKEAPPTLFEIRKEAATKMQKLAKRFLARLRLKELVFEAYYQKITEVQKTRLNDTFILSVYTIVSFNFNRNSPYKLFELK
jgi:hypothetical protein